MNGAANNEGRNKRCSRKKTHHHHHRHKARGELKREKNAGERETETEKRKRERYAQRDTETDMQMMNDEKTYTGPSMCTASALAMMTTRSRSSTSKTSTEPAPTLSTDPGDNNRTACMRRGAHPNVMVTAERSTSPSWAGRARRCDARIVRRERGVFREHSTVPSCPVWATAEHLLRPGSHRPPE